MTDDLVATLMQQLEVVNDLARRIHASQENVLDGATAE